MPTTPQHDLALAIISRLAPATISSALAARLAIEAYRADPSPENLARLTEAVDHYFVTLGGD